MPRTAPLPLRAGRTARLSARGGRKRRLGGKSDHWRWRGHVDPHDFPRCWRLRCRTGLGHRLSIHPYTGLDLRDDDVRPWSCHPNRAAAEQRADKHGRRDRPPRPRCLLGNRGAPRYYDGHISTIRCRRDGQREGVHWPRPRLPPTGPEAARSAGDPCIVGAALTVPRAVVVIVSLLVPACGLNTFGLTDGASLSASLPTGSSDGTATGAMGTTTTTGDPANPPSPWWRSRTA